MPDDAHPAPEDGPNRVELMRKRRGLTRPQLAELLNCSKESVYKLERGERQLTQDWIDRLSKALNCEPFELLPGASEESEFLEAYRSLSPSKRRFARDMLDSLVKSDSEI